MNVSVDKNFEITKKGIKAVYGDIRIVNFSREEGLISRFHRKDYFEFNPQTKRLSLTMLPLIYNKHDKLSLLADAMGYEEFQWSQEMQFRLTVDLEKDKTYVSRVNGFCITDLFEWINDDGSEPIDVTNALSSTIKRWVENNHLHAIEETIKDRIRGTVVYGLLSAIVKKRIAKDGSISNVMSHNVIDMYEGLSIQLPEINKLTSDVLVALNTDSGRGESTITKLQLKDRPYLVESRIRSYSQVYKLLQATSEILGIYTRLRRTLLPRRKL